MGILFQVLESPDGASALGALGGILVWNGLFFGDRYRGGGWVVGGWAKSGESLALQGQTPVAFGGKIVYVLLIGRKSRAVGAGRWYM